MRRAYMVAVAAILSYSSAAPASAAGYSIDGVSFVVTGWNGRALRDDEIPPITAVVLQCEQRAYRDKRMRQGAPAAISTRLIRCVREELARSPYIEQGYAVMLSP